MKVKLKSGFLIREVAGEKVLLPFGQYCVDYSKMLVLNDSAALLVESMKEGFVSTEDLIVLLSEHYDAEKCQIKKDVEELITDMVRLDMLEVE